MKINRNKLKIIFYIWASILFIIMASLPLGISNFILPPQGGGMIHCDPQMTENIRLPPPTTNVGRVWYSHGFGGEKRGTWGNGIVGNGKIAASPFSNYTGGDNLIIYDYYGNRIWSSGNLSNESGLNFFTTASNPMIDINNFVVACDNETIILVNASNFDNVKVEWTTNITHNGTWVKPIPFSPSIVENKTIVLPTDGGPLFAYNVTTGIEIANITLGQNGINESYYGIPDMPMSDFLSILSNSLSCPYHYNSQTHTVEWVSNIDYGIMPSNYIFQKGNIAFIISPNGNVSAYDNTTGEELASNSIIEPQLLQGSDYYSTINSACINGNRIFLACEKKGNKTGRLFAVDIFPNATNKSEVFKVNWTFDYPGKSQATPTLIGDTIYFDGYNHSYLPWVPKDPRIYAVYIANGTLKWSVKCQWMTWFSFAKDPRGGFWYIESGIFGDKGVNLTHHYEENGTIIEKINVSTLINDTGPFQNYMLFPCSDMTTCGTETNPIMLISVNHRQFIPGKWVVAINLSNNNTPLWKVRLPLLLTANYANGQYTVLMQDNQSRILFNTWLGGVMAIGSLSNCSFENIDYYLKDSPGDDNFYNDTVQVNYTIQTSLPDRVLVKATLISQQHPVLCRYKVKKYYNISSPTNITDSLNITLPPQAPMGSYFLQVFLYNSSGEADRDLTHLFDYLDFGLFANDTYSIGPFFLYPSNDPPETPHQPWVADVINNHMKIYATNSTDPNGDDIWYQWRYDTGLGTTYYTRWIMGGPHESGENCYRPISWWFPGEYQVQVRAKDNLLQPNVFSDWSAPLNVTVTANQGAPVPWNNELLGQFTQTLVTPAQQTSCTGFAEGVYAQTQTRESLNWNWSFGDGTYSEEQNVTHNYNTIGTYVVNLTLENGQGDYFNCTINISVVNLKSDFNIIGGQPGTNISYSDTSSGVNTIANWTWDFGDGNSSYQQNPMHVYATSGIYNVSLTVKDNQNNTHLSTQTLYIESLKPQYVSVVDYPDPVGFGQNVTIEVNIFDNLSGIQAVYLNITYPDNETTGNFSMEANMSYPCDYIYVFKDTWQTGVYNYSIWVIDNANNTNCTSGFNFPVSGEAVITVCTTKDTYTSNEFINLTDPPGNPSPTLGYELLDDGAVLHLWNQFDSYYFNTSNGIQLTNHKNEYWSHNVLMLGYYHNDQWNLLYRTDELTGFTRDIEIDESSYVNVTLWKDLFYGGYSFRLAVRYHLGVYDHDLTVIPYIKNIGTTSIPYVLGFGWELKDIQINMTTQGDYILVDQDKYLLNQTLDNSYTRLNDTVFYLKEDVTGSQTQSLYLRWNPDLTYKLLVKSRSGQQNAPVTLFIRVGTLAVGQQKHTLLRWYDASQETFYFNGFDENEAWEHDPELMIDESEESFAFTTNRDLEVELCNENTCPGDDQGTILKVELRVNGYYEGRTPGNITLRPVFRNGGLMGENYTFVPSDRPEWSDWFDITSDGGHGSGQWITPWSWSEISTLDCDVEATLEEETTLYCSMVELRVTYNTAPVVSNPSPAYGVNGVGLQPWVNITISDPDEDSMNITWYSNSTPSLLTLRPNANGSSTQLSRHPGSATANYLCVDEAVADDADYVYWSGTTWKNDTYTLENHGNVSGVIHGVTVYARCNRGGIGGYPSVPNQGKIVIKSGSGYYDGNEFTPTSTFTSYSHTWSVNPATGTAWNWSAVDALEVGVAFIGNEAGDCKCSQVYVVVNYTNPNTWYQFGMNSSVSNGVYRQQLLNASVNGQWWYWKVKADDGTASTWSSVYKFYTGYQSKIENTGETTIKGYLLMQVQYYNETLESWVVDNDTVNETSPRTITSGNQLALDTIFNGQVRASDLTHGTGTYRVYAAFRDPEGNILNTSDQTKLEAWWQFSKT